MPAVAGEAGTEGRKYLSTLLTNLRGSAQDVRLCVAIVRPGVMSATRARPPRDRAGAGQSESVKRDRSARGLGDPSDGSSWRSGGSPRLIHRRRAIQTDHQ